MRIIGITGGVGAGKSTILDYLESRYHAYILKSDDVARSIQLPGGVIHEQMRSLLEEYPTGNALMQEDGTFDNKEIAQRIFYNPELLERVNALVHPAVRQCVLEAIAREREAGRAYFVLEAALLIECGYGEMVDTMWYIYCDDEIRRGRLKASRGYTDSKIDHIMANQLSDAGFRNSSDVVIDNGGTPEQTYQQIDLAMQEIA